MMDFVFPANQDDKTFLNAGPPCNNPSADVLSIRAKLQIDMRPVPPTNNLTSSYVAKSLVALVAVIVFNTTVSGQDFVQCAQSCKDEFNRVHNLESAKSVTSSFADSLRKVALDAFDSCIIGKTLPEFTLTATSGRTYTNGSLAGKIVMLNIWSTRCGPCIMEIPVLNRIAESYGKNEKFILLSIMEDTEEQRNQVFNRFLRPMRIEYDIIPGAKELLKEKFKLMRLYPTTLFLDEEGKIYHKHVGGILDSKDEQKLESQYRAIIDSRLKD